MGIDGHPSEDAAAWARNVSAHPDAVFLSFEGRTWTFAELDAVVDAWVDDLAGRGVGPSARIATFMANSRDVDRRRARCSSQRRC